MLEDGDVTIRPATRDDFPAIAAWIPAMNARPDQRCLHCADKPAGVERGLAELGLPPEQSLLMALTGGRLTGLVGADLATDLGRGWLWGPCAESDDVADALARQFMAGSRAAGGSD